MTDPNLTPQWLCASGDLKECEGSITFEVMEWGKLTPAFAVRFDNQLTSEAAAVAPMNVRMAR